MATLQLEESGSGEERRAGDHGRQEDPAQARQGKDRLLSMSKEVRMDSRESRCIQALASMADGSGGRPLRMRSVELDSTGRCMAKD